MLLTRSRDLDDTLFGFTWIDLNDLNSKKPESHELHLPINNLLTWQARHESVLNIRFQQIERRVREFLRLSDNVKTPEVELNCGASARYQHAQSPTPDHCGLVTDLLVWIWPRPRICLEIRVISDVTHHGLPWLCGWPLYTPGCGREYCLSNTIVIFFCLSQEQEWRLEVQ